MHTAERGFHNYSMPYSWDVRLGHKERDAAVAELDDELDPVSIRDMLDRVGYRPRAAEPNDRRLVAYYTGIDIPGVELRRFLAQSLPRDVIPSAFVRLDQLPLAASGKVDRAALPQPESGRPSLAGTFVAPRTPTERLLVEVWSDVLDVRPIGIHDDFFELGGDSMQCIQIVSAARERGIAFTPRDVFAHPTIAGIALVAAPVEPLIQPLRAMASERELQEIYDEFGA